ncbi:hypothetical protein [Bradyrhizobium sp. USDA 4452]
MLTRRAILSGTIAACCCPTLGAARSVSEIAGCWLLPGETSLLGLGEKDFGALPNSDDMTNTSGDKNLDRALGRALARISSAFKVNPSFAFFADDNSPNAYASPDTNTAGTHGSVVFGRTLFQDQFRRYNDQGVSVLAIAAHEFGHICQFQQNLSGALQGSERTVRRIELHADYLSGWYLGLLKKRNSSISLWSSGDTFHRIGDSNFTNKQHHGTPEERVAASKAGFDLANGGEENVQGAIMRGKDYILSLPPQQ